MAVIANIVVGLIGVLHVYILVLEMFFWDKPAGLRAFGQTRQAASASKTLAANQGLYNSFLAAGLFWGLSLGTSGTDVKAFFLCCVFIAGLYGAATASRRILAIQAVPAAVGLVLVPLNPTYVMHSVGRMDQPRDKSRGRYGKEAGEFIAHHSDSCDGRPFRPKAASDNRRDADSLKEPLINLIKRADARRGQATRSEAERTAPAGPKGEVQHRVTNGVYTASAAPRPRILSLAATRQMPLQRINQRFLNG